MTYCKEVNFVSYGVQKKVEGRRGRVENSSLPTYIGEGTSSYEAAFDAFHLAHRDGYNVGSELDKRLMATYEKTVKADHDDYTCYFMIQLEV